MIWETGSWVILCRRDRSIAYDLLIDRTVRLLGRLRKSVVRLLKRWAVFHHSPVDLDNDNKKGEIAHAKNVIEEDEDINVMRYDVEAERLW